MISVFFLRREGVFFSFSCLVLWSTIILSSIVLGIPVDLGMLKLGGGWQRAPVFFVSKNGPRA
jgi:hypothetical protein